MDVAKWVNIRGQKYVLTSNKYINSILPPKINEQYCQIWVTRVCCVSQIYIFLQSNFTSRAGCLGSTLRFLTSSYSVLFNYY